MLTVTELLRLVNGNAKSCLPEVARRLILSWLLACNANEGYHFVFLLNSILSASSKTLQSSEDAADILSCTIDSLFRGREASDDGSKKHMITWEHVNKSITFPDTEKVSGFLDRCVSRGYCLILFSYVTRQLRFCRGLKDEEVLLASLIDWMRRLNLSHDCEPKLTVLYYQCLVLIQRQWLSGAKMASLAKQVMDLIDVLLMVARTEEASAWNIFGIIGLSSSYQPRPRAKFLSLSLAYFLLRQILVGPKLRTKKMSTEKAENEDKKFHLNSKLEKCYQYLVSLRTDEAYVDLQDSLDWVVEKIERSVQHFRRFLAVFEPSGDSQ